MRKGRRTSRNNIELQIEKVLSQLETEGVVGVRLPNHQYLCILDSALLSANGSINLDDDVEFLYPHSLLPKIPLCSACKAPLEVLPSDPEGYEWLIQHVGVRGDDDLYYIDYQKLDNFLNVYGEVGEIWIQKAIEDGYLFEDEMETPFEGLDLSYEGDDDLWE